MCVCNLNYFATFCRLSAVEETGTQSAISKLVIKGASRSDSALYTCTATNEFGNDQTNIQLVVQGNLYFIQIQLRIFYFDDFYKPYYVF